ncbi:NnrS family protein [Arhodomonas sp. SL1]|uniref:NnrS family protein n=1 Tax=Arhodomonas sp. SL1 TaxID=3425691 RepID=UPI003F88377B
MSVTAHAGRQRSAQGLFFPLAAAYAAVVNPLSVYALTRGTPLFPGLTGPSGHAHEMLFGLALAVVAGFTINRAPARTLALLVGLWAGARLAFLLAPGGWIAITANAGFAALLAGQAAPQFLRGAKKWRNRAIAPILLMATATALAFQLGDLVTWPTLRRLALLEAVLILAALMLFMGGRLIAPAAAGHLRGKGITLEARVQPRLEGALLLCAGVAVVSFPLPGGEPVAGLAASGAAAIAALRLARWQLWRCMGRHDLLLLGVGYAWLVAGLALLGGTWLTGHPPPTTALHGITVGALGTLTITVMARTRRVTGKLPAHHLPDIIAAVAAVSAAALLRITTPDWWLVASLLWSLAYALLLVHLLRLRRSRRPR